ncbi:MAG: hypothetical protein IJ648_05470, partial [Lachnospiraceae bacterium]|nr:hypothetical protein [Lachnospiraceae bacterium]
MSQYKDKELNRLLSESDDILADLNLNLYETPAEEQARKAREEEQRRIEEEKRQQEELRRQEEELRKIQEEEKRKQEEELRKIQEEEKRKQEEELRKIQEEEKRKQEEELRKIREEEKRKQEEKLHKIPNEEKQESEENITKSEEFDREEELPSEPLMQDNGLLQEDLKPYHPSQPEDIPKPESSEHPETVQIQEKQSESPGGARNSSFEMGGMIFLILSFMYMEVITHVGIYHAISTDFIFPLFFAASVGCLVRMLSCFMGLKGNTAVVIVCELLYAVYCDMQIACHAVTGTYLRFSHLSGDLNAFIHNEQMTSGIASVLLWMVLMFLPIIFWAVIG